jgi:hypothetical protein
MKGAGGHTDESISEGGNEQKKILRNTDVIHLLNLPSGHFLAGFPLQTYIYISALILSSP